MGRWLLSFVGIDPRNPQNEQREMGVKEEHYRYLQHHGDEKAIARLWLVGQVLQGGTACIYKGWGRGKDDCHIYVGYPGEDRKSLTITTPPPPNMAFLVFVLPDGTIENWTWRPLISGGITPEGMEGEIVWEQSTT
jgi:hypothetical protein